jgi:hypothetical protein
MKIVKEILILALGFVLASATLSMFAAAYEGSSVSSRPMIVSIGALVVTAYVAYLRKTRKTS